MFWPGVRWLLVVPSAVISWFLVLLGGTLVYSFVSDLCPPEQVVSGLCNAPHIILLEELSILMTAALSAVSVVCIPPLVAPSHKIHVATIAYLLGIIALLTLTNNVMEKESLAAFICGAIALLLQALFRRKKNQK